MTTNRVRSFDRSGSAPEGALTRRVIRLLPGLNISRDSMDSRDWKKALDCTSVRMYESTMVCGSFDIQDSAFDIRYCHASRL